MTTVERSSTPNRLSASENINPNWIIKTPTNQHEFPHECRLLGCIADPEQRQLHSMEIWCLLLNIRTRTRKVPGRWHWSTRWLRPTRHAQNGNSESWHHLRFNFIAYLFLEIGEKSIIKTPKSLMTIIKEILKRPQHSKSTSDLHKASSPSP